MLYNIVYMNVFLVLTHTHTYSDRHLSVAGANKQDGYR